MPRQLGRCYHGEGVVLEGVQLGGRILSCHSGSGAHAHLCWIHWLQPRIISCEQQDLVASSFSLVYGVLAPYVYCGLDVYC